MLLPKSKEGITDMYQKTMMAMIPQVSENFNILGKIGEGTFSKVYMATSKHRPGHDNIQQTRFALKYLLPIVKPGRMAKEIRILRDMKGECNIIPLHSVLFGDGHVVIVMPIISHEKFSSYFQHLTPPYIRDYMRKLLTAVARIHQDHIVHRDIKPANFLYDYKTGKCALVDFGLSQTESEIENGTRQVTHKVTQRTREIEARKDNPESNGQKDEQPSNHQVNVPSSSHIETDSTNKTMKRKLFDASDDLPLITNDDESQSKKLRTRTPFKIDDTNSFMISPVTPESKKISLPVVPETPYKKRSPMKELNYELDCTVLSACMNFNQQFKTPVKDVKTNVSCLETPPKTIRQSNAAAASVAAQTSKDLFQNDFSKTPIFPSSKSLLPPKKFLNFQEASNIKNSLRSLDCDSAEDEICDCLHKDEVCLYCHYKQPEFHVPRAGTPGFRAPEVLLRSATQTCKIDIWSVGVLFASILSGRYPFFRSVDDLTSLAEITELFGSKKISSIASKMDRTFVIDKKIRPKDSLRNIVQRLRESLYQHRQGTIKPLKMPVEAYDLLDFLLEPDPEIRLSAADALEHPFFSEKLLL